jgi:subtilisin
MTRERLLYDPRISVMRRSRPAIVRSLGRHPRSVVVVAFILFGAGVGPTPGLAGAESPSARSNPASVADQYVVVLRDDADAQASAKAAVQKQRVKVLHVYEHAFKGFAFHGSAQAANAIENSPQVDFVAPDRVVELDAQTLPTGIDRIDADLNPISHIDGVDERVNVNVAIVDTGIDPTHPDLNVVGGTNCLGGSSFVDGHGHGSHVAGTVGAIDNGLGVVGVAPGANLYAVKVLDDSGFGSFSSVACGLDFVAGTRRDRDPTNDVAVANMSLGGGGSDDGNCGKTNHDILHKAVCGAVARGVVVVVAAGNSHADAATFVPAAYDESLTISAIADFNGQPGEKGKGKRINPDLFASFSNFGPDVDIAGPGVQILSTFKDGGYATLSGTSMATPHVTGAVALYVSQNGAANDANGVAAIRQAIATPGGGYSVAQNDPRGFAGDPDSFHEPLVYVGPP